MNSSSAEMTHEMPGDVKFCAYLPTLQLQSLSVRRYCRNWGLYEPEESHSRISGAQVTLSEDRDHAVAVIRAPPRADAVPVRVAQRHLLHVLWPISGYSEGLNTTPSMPCIEGYYVVRWVLTCVWNDVPLGRFGEHDAATINRGTHVSRASVGRISRLLFLVIASPNRLVSVAIEPEIPMKLDG